MNTKQKILFYLLSLQSVFWFLLTIGTLYLRRNAIIATVMILNALLFMFFAWNVKNHNRQIYLVCFFYVALNFLLTITDQFGGLDLVALALNLATLVFLILDRKYFKS
jgi:hypothetical protein